MVDEIGVNTPAAAAQVLKYTRKMFNFSIEKQSLIVTPVSVSRQNRTKSENGHCPKKR